MFVTPLAFLLVPSGSLGLILTVAGALLLKFGARTRRVGDTPHCPRCNYILTGQQVRCPECGTAVDARTVVRGQRRTRTGVLVTGVFMISAGLGVMLIGTALSIIYRVDWNRHKPLRWLLADMGESNTPAWMEIHRRLDEHLLTESEQNAVVEKGLALPLQNIIYTRDTVLHYIASRYLQDALSPSQADRFIAHVLKVNLKVRPVVGMSSPTPFAISGHRFGLGNSWTRWRAIEWQLDDGPVQKNIVLPADGGYSEWTENNDLPPVGTSGKHRLRLRIDLEMMQSEESIKPPWDLKGEPRRRRMHDLFCSFEAVAGEAPISVVTLPEAAMLRPLVTPTMTFHPRTRFPLQVSLDIKPLPVDAVFDVLVRFDGKERPAGCTRYRNARRVRDHPKTASRHFLCRQRSGDAARRTQRAGASAYHRAYG